MFCVACLATGKFVIGLDTDTLRTLTVITLVFSGQALFYMARKKATPRARCWGDGSSCPRS
jgi:H+-transporting ATPase